MSDAPVPAPRSRRQVFLIGFVSACVLLPLLREGVNETSFADKVVGPLLASDTNGTADAIVVPGAGVTGPCAPNVNAVQRVLHATRAWREQRAPIIVFTGGAGANPCPIAEAMAALAREVGIPATAVYTETASRSTRENARLSSPLLHRLGVRRVLVVTDRLHLRRAAAVFAAEGFVVERRSVPIYDGHKNNADMLVVGLREYAALFYYKMRGWMDAQATSGSVTAAGSSSSGSDMNVRYPSGPMVVLGASYAGGWKVDRIGQFAVNNKGVSGQQSFEMLQRFDRDVVAANPRAVILWGFINDIFRAQNADAAAARARDSFTKMVSLAREHGIEPVIATEVTIRPEASWLNPLAALYGTIRGKESYQARINRYVMETNRWLVDLARREGLLMLDFQSMTADGNGMRRKEYAAEDGSHIAAAGYAALTAYATPILEHHFNTAP